MASVGTTELILIFAIFIFLAMPVLIMIVFVVMKSLKNRQSNLKKCPFCAEMIQLEANVCRYCRKDLV